MDDAKWCLEALRLAKEPGDATFVLEELVVYLDRPRTRDFDSVERRFLARAIGAVGPFLHANVGGDSILRTMNAALAFADEPSQATELAYFEAATDTYPYGSGEGHYAIRGRQDCAPGSGCSTGAGSLVDVASTVGAREVLDAIVRELEPWVLARFARRDRR